ncbi:hypothetical protein JS756_01720 [Streptomyces actuosus]|uniref:DUF3592 domain-containing protein n=1 Tax=Streptomyces actuosus TaxID=1885 RepID=A0ABS2VID1_STRAS|nr:hypothetical protein [Streptomyces actuosus]MBN0042851.1 hypothetical protein [Streptomyces actuosus]
MRRWRRRPETVAPHLLAHLRETVWGPAEFVGAPPWRLVAEGLLTGLLGAAAIVGGTVAGAWYALPSLASGEGALVCAGATVLYLALIGAGRALIGIAAVLGVCLALQAPQAAAGVVLAERGRVQAVEVTSVQRGPGVTAAHGRTFCSVSDGGVALDVHIWRGCDDATRPGDTVAVVYDPKGRIPPRGVGGDLSWRGPLRGLAGTTGALVAACVLAVVRSCRITPAEPG